MEFEYRIIFDATDIKDAEWKVNQLSMLARKLSPHYVGSWGELSKYGSLKHEHFRPKWIRKIERLIEESKK